MARDYNKIISKIVTAAGGSKTSKDILRKKLRRDFSKNILRGDNLRSYRISTGKNNRLDVRLDWDKK